MIYNILGKTELQVSAIGMGCSGIGNTLYKRNAKEGYNTLIEAFESGINFFDTAPNYNNGDSERLIGKALKSKREKIFISSKAGITFTKAGLAAKKIKPYLYPLKNLLSPFKNKLPDLYKSQRSNNFSKEFIFKSVEGSLKRLQTDYLDLLLLHHPTNEVLRTGDFCETFDLLKSQGKIRHYGVSCDSIDQGILSSQLSNVSVIQIELNVIDNEAVKKLLPVTLEKNMGVIARLPLAKGLLSDITSNTKAENWTIDRRLLYERKRKADYFRFLVKKNRSLVQSALKFLLQLGGVSVALPGFSSRNHLIEILGAVDVEPLNDSEFNKIFIG